MPVDALRRRSKFAGRWRRHRWEADQVRIAYIPCAVQQYLRGPLREVRRSHPETLLKLVNLSPGKQMNALRAGEIDIGITNESGELLAREFYTRTLAETGSYIAVSEHHPLATQDRVRLSDLKSEFFVNWDSQQLPRPRTGGSRRIAKNTESFARNFTARREALHTPPSS
jgi:DNA-binding transcriptional LysR family regulator